MTTPISDILDKLDLTTQAYTFNGYAALVHSVMLPVTLAITAYIAFVGWMMLMGWSQMTVGQIVKHVLKIAIAYTIATQWNYFAEFIYSVFMNGPNELSSVLMQSTGSNSTSVNTALQSAFDQGMTIGETLYNLKGFSIKIAAIVVWILNFLVSGIALLELAVAKCGFAVTMVLAPVFALCLLWQGSKSLFDRWLATALGFGLVPLFLCAVLLIIDQILQIGLSDINNAIMSGTEKIQSIATFVLGSIASFGLLLRATTIATNIASGINVSSIGVAVSTARMADTFSGFKSVRQLGKHLIQSRSRPHGKV